MIKNYLEAIRAWTASPRLEKSIFAGFLIITFLIYTGSSRYRISGDNYWYLPTAISTLREGNIELGEYSQLIQSLPSQYAISDVDGNYYNYFPLGPSIIALPVVATGDFFARQILGIDLQNYALTNLLLALDRFTAALVTILTIAILYRVTRRVLSFFSSLILIIIFAFGTSAWSQTSVTYWQQSASMLILICGYWLLVQYSDNRFNPLLLLCGAIFGFSFIVRPTNAISIIIFAIYIYFMFRSMVSFYILGVIIILVPWVILNLNLYDQLFPPYFVASERGFSITGFLTGLSGVLFSPSRGLIIYTPILLFAYAAVLRRLLLRKSRTIEPALLAIVGIHTVVVSLVPYWYGGHSYGPRLMIDILPFSFVLLALVVKTQANQILRQKWLLSALVLCSMWGVFVHYRGATSEAVYRWNGTPDNINMSRYRLWDWYDPPFFRTRVLDYPIIAQQDSEARFDIALGSIRIEFENDFDGNGWSKAEDWFGTQSFRWSSSESATVQLPALPDSDYVLEIGIIRAMEDDLLSTLRVLVNEQEVDLGIYPNLENQFRLVARVPSSLINAEQPVLIAIVVDRLVFIQDVVDTDDDFRYLGIAVDWLQMTQVR